MSKNGFSLKSENFYIKHRGEYVQKNIIVFKKKKKNSISDFHYSYSILNIANFEFHNSYLSYYEAFSITFSNFFDFFDFHSFYLTFKLYNISNEKNEENNLNTLIFELQCDYMRVLKCVNYLKHKRFIKVRKICRDLTHFVFKCSVINYSINQLFHLLSTIIL